MVEASIAIQVLPQKQTLPEKELIRIVDQVISYIQSTGLKHVVCPFETVVEGPLPELLKIVEKSQQICIEEGADSVYSYVRIAYAPSGKGVLSIDDKIGKYRN